MELDQLSKSEILRGAKLCSANAERLYHGALQIESQSNYGMANSLLILSVEEFIKAFVLVALHFDIEVDFDVKPIFSNHSFKHAQGVKMTPVLRLVRLVNLFFEDHKTATSKIAEVLKVVSEVYSKKKREELEEWWQSANRIKNVGFYVDCQGGDWLSPDNLSKDLFLQSKSIVEMFKDASKWVDKLDEDDYERLLSK